jgi:preprotein translocase subunit SecB
MATKKKSTADSRTKSYEEFVRGLRLIILALRSSSSRIDRQEFFRATEEEKPTAERKISANYEVEQIGEDFFDAIGKFTLTVRAAGAGEALLTVECAFEAHFHTKGGPDKEFAKRFTESEFRLVVWPYFRQFVSDMTARMYIPPIIPPLSTET